jgi:hypothetical protein
VVRWNDATLNAIKAERTPPPVAARNLAIVHVAIYDTLCAVDRKYQPFHADERAPAGSSIEGAAAAAAYRTLVALYPRQVPAFDEAMRATVAALPGGRVSISDIDVGQSIARKVLAWRDADRAVAKSSYTTTQKAGHWQRTPPDYREPLLPEWANIRPFALRDVNEFHPPDPPELGSAQFIAAYSEVKDFGAKQSAVRSPEQTQIAQFWADGDGTVTPPGHWNRIAAGVALARRLPTVETARLFAMLNVALADAAIACWDCKFGFDFWRPVTAIRSADSLQNGSLAADPNWEPLLPTPPFPSYTSGHSTFSGAAAAVLAAFFGSDRVSFVTTSDALPGVIRRFDSFSAAANEAGMSRIYGGIHWQFDNTAGLDGGRRVGEYVSTNFFKRVD